jgi:ribosomal protein L37E
MSEMHGALRQMPCPDCGNPVVPDRDQLCPNCGYPLMFLRKSSGDQDARAQAIPRSPNRDDETGLRAVPQPVPQPRTDTRQFPAATYGAGGGGQIRCPSCGYSNEPTRVRCERCGFEMRAAQPRGVQLAPPVYSKGQAGGGGWGWVLWLVLVLAIIALIVLAVTIVWLMLE